MLNVSKHNFLRILRHIFFFIWPINSFHLNESIYRSNDVIKSIEIHLSYDDIHDFIVQLATIV